MSCYFRHLKDIFGEAGITITPGNSQKIDRAIQEIVGTAGRPCPETWSRLKELLADGQRRRQLVGQLKSSL